MMIRLLFWNIFVSYTYVFLFGHVIPMGSDRNFSFPTSYADCINHKLLLTELDNTSLKETQAFCNTLFLKQKNELLRKMKDPNVANFVSHLVRGVHARMHQSAKRRKRSIYDSSVHYRKEVREPPYEDNWGRYVTNVRRLKHNYDVRPDMNTYDVIASLHISDEVIPTAHDGPGFFSWHREYLKVMELALGCPIPYWDTTLDEAMDDSSDSSIWSEKYFGNGYGLVSTGIIKDLPSLLPILRNINSGGWLISRKDVNITMTRPSLVEFTEWSDCNGDDRTVYSWECFHKGIHDWIDGTIGPSNTTTFDPIFFPIHAYVDKIFEHFRQKLIAKGIDPEKTYPEKHITDHEPHHKTIWMPIYPDILSLTNRQCYGDKLASLTKYSAGPKCPDCFGGVDLYCDTEINSCVAKRRKTDDKYIIKSVAVMTSYGVMFFDTYVLDEPERTKEIIKRTGPLPFGKKFKVGFPDNRTRNDSTPELG